MCRRSRSTRSRCVDGRATDWQVGRTLLNKLEQVSPNPSVPAPDLSRQEQLDAAIQKKLHEELGKLRKQEKEVQTQIELALEKENLDKQAKSWFSRDKGQSSVLLQQELDRVKAQNEKYQHRSVADYPELQKARDAVSQCFLYVPASSHTQREQAPHPGLLEGGRGVQEGHGRRREGMWLPGVTDTIDRYGDLEVDGAP